MSFYKDTPFTNNINLSNFIQNNWNNVNKSFALQRDDLITYMGKCLPKRSKLSLKYEIIQPIPVTLLSESYVML